MIHQHLARAVGFAFLPGDNADGGTEDQYKLVKAALDRLKIPVHIITGDHNRKSGTLAPFQQYLEPDLYRSLDLGGLRFLFLDAMDAPESNMFDFRSRHSTGSRRKSQTHMPGISESSCLIIFTPVN